MKNSRGVTVNLPGNPGGSTSKKSISSTVQSTFLKKKQKDLYINFTITSHGEKRARQDLWNHM